MLWKTSCSEIDLSNELHGFFANRQNLEILQPSYLSPNNCSVRDQVLSTPYSLTSTPSKDLLPPGCVGIVRVVVDWFVLLGERIAVEDGGGVFGAEEGCV